MLPVGFRSRRRLHNCGTGLTSDQKGSWPHTCTLVLGISYHQVVGRLVDGFAAKVVGQTAVQAVANAVARHVVRGTNIDSLGGGFGMSCTADREESPSRSVSP